MQILTQEDWNIVLFLGMQRTSHWAALYFVALMTFGNYVLFNLLVAILVEGFSNQVRRPLKGLSILKLTYIVSHLWSCTKVLLLLKVKKKFEAKLKKRVELEHQLLNIFYFDHYSYFSIINQCSFDSLYYCCLHTVLSALIYDSICKKKSRAEKCVKVVDCQTESMLQEYVPAFNNPNHKNPCETVSAKNPYKKSIPADQNP